ncbi:NEIL3 Endonuclease, partial [Amia calva]|nr:NEIL3 Endonuclease [Amia calva]
MVEGPGCAINGEKIRCKIQKGQKVKEIRKGCVSEAKRGCPAPTEACKVFSGSRFSGVQTLGKELFMYFGPRALRIHFGMNGSMQINPSERRDRSGAPSALEVLMMTDTVCFFDSTVEIRLTADCEQKVKAMESLDVCSPQFSFTRAEGEVRKHGGRMLCDVLLDQAVLPGVGNIIKNEALFDSGLHPTVKVHQLTEVQIHHLVKMTRDFTMLFYKCRKSGSPLYKHYKVYKRPSCGQCDGKVAVCRLGDNGRMTYFCHLCQNRDPRQVHVNKLPVRNSLIGWAYGGAEWQSDNQVAKKDEEEWVCDRCTLINQPGEKSCNACFTSRPDVPKEEIKEKFSSFTRDLIKFPHNAFLRPQEELKVNRTAVFGTSTLVFTDLSSKSLSSSSRLLGSAKSPLGANGSLNQPGLSHGETSPNYSCTVSKRKSSELSNTAYNQPPKKMKTDPPSFSNRAHSNSTFSEPRPQMTAVPSASVPATPCCATHGRPCVLRVVKKDGGNKGRPFHACSLPRDTQLG